MKRPASIFFPVCLALALSGAALEVYNSFAAVSNIPTSAFWSEGGRIYNAFQIYAPLISQAPFSWPWLDPARSLVDGLALLIPASQIWMWRVWVKALFLISAALTAWLLVRRVWRAAEGQQSIPSNPRNPFLFGLLIAWVSLFLLQGPVYYHLLLGIVPVLWLYQPGRGRWTALLVAALGAWAGLGRVNWFWMPSITAALLYLLEEPRKDTPLLRYLGWPLAWGLANGLTSLPVYWLSLALAGKPSIFDRSMDYAYLREKLWPNPANPPGLVGGIFLLTAPLAAVILIQFWAQRKQVNGLRSALLASALAVLGAGSTLVSLRAGGGYDFHNYDTLLLALAIVGVYSGLGAVAPDDPFPAPKKPLLDYRLVGALTLIPMLLLLTQMPAPPDAAAASAARQTVQDINASLASRAVGSTKPILFIDYRQLLVYHLVPWQEIYAPYEQVELMEMAMANNKAFFRQFQADIAQQKFSLIVGSVLWEGEKRAGSDPYWYESNVWSNYVASVIHQYYALAFQDKARDLEIYAPKP